MMYLANEGVQLIYGTGRVMYLWKLSSGEVNALHAHALLFV